LGLGPGSTSHTCRAKTGEKKMTDKYTVPDPKILVGLFAEIKRNGQLLWRLFTSAQVPIWAKLIPPLAILYVLSPVDFVPDPILGLGQMDDLAVLLLGARLFVELCPSDLVERIRYELTYGHSSEDAEVVDATYQVIDDD
jgi:uncharacterized membrane protein YkvA (DUF1232 family)